MTKQKEYGGFPIHEWNSFHDVVYEAFNASMNRKELKAIYDSLPRYLQGNAVSWGLSDTCFRDSVYEYLKETYPELVPE